jgi:type I restriction enzyme R subunit
VNEADTCRKLVLPRLLAAGWDSEPHSIAEQRTITDGRIVPAGKGFILKPPRRVDYLLRYTRDFPLAVLEAKPGHKAATDGLQQAKDYAEMLGLKFAYATNGYNIVEFDYARGLEPEIRRPFVWEATKVRNLLDSLHRGYPVGYRIAWRNRR